MKRKKPRKPAPRAKVNTAPAASAGVNALRAQGLSMRTLAKELGVTASAVHGWLSGAKSPGASSRRRIHVAYGVEPDAWDTAAPSPASNGHAATSSPAALRRDLDVLAGAIDLAMTLRAVRLDPSASATTRLKAAAAESSTLALVARLQVQDLDALIVGHPNWPAMRDAWVSAVSGCETCLLRVYRVLTPLLRSAEEREHHERALQRLTASSPDAPA